MLCLSCYTISKPRVRLSQVAELPSMKKKEKEREKKKEKEHPQKTNKQTNKQTNHHYFLALPVNLMVMVSMQFLFGFRFRATRPEPQFRGYFALLCNAVYRYRAHYQLWQMSWWHHKTWGVYWYFGFVQHLVSEKSINLLRFRLHPQRSARHQSSVADVLTIYLVPAAVVGILSTALSLWCILRWHFLVEDTCAGKITVCKWCIRIWPLAHVAVVTVLL